MACSLAHLHVLYQRRIQTGRSGQQLLTQDTSPLLQTPLEEKDEQQDKEEDSF